MGIPIARIVVQPSAVQVGSSGEVTILNAEARDDDGNVLPRRTITWSTSDPSHAYVSSSGVVVASSATSLITASAEQKSASASVVVKADAPTPFLLEDFSSYTSTSNFLENPRGYYVRSEDTGTQDIVLDSTVGFGNATRSMRYDFPDRTSEVSARCSDKGRRRFLTLSPPYVNNVGAGRNHVWVDLWIKFSSNFTVSAPPSWNCQSGAAYKFLGGPVFGPDAGRFLVATLASAWTIEIPDNSVLFGRNILGPVVNGTAVSPQYFYDNRWHRWRYEMKISSARGVPDGVFNAWIDDRVWFRSGPQVINRSSIWAIGLGANMNQGPAELQHLWYGRMSLLASDPGW